MPDSGATRIDDLIASLTRRLRPDAELRMDVAHELRAHLEDAAAAARDSGLDDSAALDAALKSFGDADALEAALFRANRRRMRLRAVVRWALRLTMLPVAILFALWLWADAAQLDPAVMLQAAGDENPLGGLDTARHGQAFREGLSPKERLLRNVILHPAADERTTYANRLAAACPADPVYRAWQVNCLINDHRLKPPSAPSPENLLSAIDEGERVEPDNAYWNYTRAYVLLDVLGAATIDYDASPEAIKLKTGEGPAETARYYPIAVKDAEGFRRALAEYRKGVRKAHYNNHAADMVERKWALQVRPKRLSDEIMMISIATSELLPSLTRIRLMGRMATNYAHQLTAEGRPGEAAELLRTSTVPGTQIGRSARFMIELLAAAHARRSGLVAAATHYEALNMPDAALSAHHVLTHEDALLNEATGRANDLSREDIAAMETQARKRFGVMGGLLAMTVPVRETHLLEALREAEHFAAERGALAALGTVLLIVILARGAFVLAAMWRHRRGARGPKLLFIGWQRTATAVLVSALVPLALYAALTRNPWTGSLRLGLGYASGRVLVETTLAGTAVLVLALWFGERAARTRCREAGMAAGMRPLGRVARWALLAVAVAVAGTLGVYAFTWETEGWRLPWGFFAVLVVMLAAAAVHVIVWRSQRPRTAAEREVRTTIVRSTLPVLVGVLLVIGLVARWHLAAGEAARVAALNRPGERLFLDEVSMLRAADYRAWLRTLPDNGALPLRGDLSGAKGDAAIPESESPGVRER